ncbi:MAG: hypothetical protein A2749_02930 [Parcubacteria group bacterium RIFCSPHIGHO2_01_FULL_45_26]|nr:MAG: hypothetical protein A2749_02930 [Parcubacteria group bacterium RIFCSPHIGHO2_01_FULL_45_26]
MKRVVIVHCWAGTPDSRWYPYAKRELEKAGFVVEIPAMPDTDMPRFDKWFNKLKEVAGIPNNNLYLVGHSLGGPIIMRYLQDLLAGTKIGGVVFVAVPTDTLDNVEAIEDKSVLPEFFGSGINWQKVKEAGRKFIGIYSDNDPYIDLKHAEVLKNKVDAEIIYKHGLGHMSEPDGEGDVVIVKELPDVVDAIKKLTAST